MIYVCCDERRRDAVRAHGTLNGIDFLEVLDDLTLVGRTSSSPWAAAPWLESKSGSRAVSAFET